MIHAAIVGAAIGLAAASWQTRDEGWGAARLQPREVKQIYWESQRSIEIAVRLVPEDPDGKPLRVNLIFHAFFDGRTQRDPYSAERQLPDGPPARLAVTAQAFANTFVIPQLSLELTIDHSTIDLTPPGGRYRNIPCLVATDACTPNGVEAELEPDVLQRAVRAGSVRGRALGWPFMLSEADRRALAEFAARVRLGEPKRHP